MPFVLALTHFTSLLWPPLLALLPGPAALALASVLSFFHFYASLVLFYSQPALRKKFPRVAWQFPLALLLLLGAWMALWPVPFARYLIFFFVFLFWHYAKQSYGFFVLSFRGEARMEDPNSFERQCVLLYFLVAALFGFLSTQTSGGTMLAFGIYVPTLNLPLAPILWTGRAACALGLGYCLWICIRYRRWAPLCTAVSFYLWTDLRLWNYQLLFLLPAFHALQYLPIVGRRVFSQKARVTLVVAGAALSCAMYFLFRAHPVTGVGVLGLLGVLEIVMNLHHYFIDAYIWRFRDPEIRAELN
ncbi:MAG: hypothetical protein ACXVB9_17785 [Bdellovibrionota bacterium]